MTWNDVSFDLWWSELAWIFLKNKEGVPDHPVAQWHWKAGYGPAQVYYKLSVKHQPQTDPAAEQQSR